MVQYSQLDLQHIATLIMLFILKKPEVSKAKENPKVETPTIETPINQAPGAAKATVSKI